MKVIKQIVVRLVVGCVITCTLTSIAYGQTQEEIEARRAAARAKAEEFRRYLQEMTDKVIAESAERAKLHPPLSPDQQAAHQAIGAAKQAAEWQKTLEAAQPLKRSLGQPEDTESPDTRAAAQTELQDLARKAESAQADAPRIEAELEAISIILGAERERVREDGSREILGGQIDGEPVYYSSQNLFAVASISADELWPTNITGIIPWAFASAGRNLTGTNVTLGLWETDGAVMTNHYEFGPRVRQVDQSATNAIPGDDHATGVAGTMAANGYAMFVVLGHQPVPLMRGVAYEATANSYDFNFFSTERLQAAGGTVTGQPLRLSNHSYGTTTAWIQQTIQTSSTNTITNAWIWRGSPALAEEWKFGFYTSDPGDGSGCTNIDHFLAQDATRHLMVYAAGNDRFGGPGGPTNYFYKSGGGIYDWTSVTNPPSNSRDWINGDGDTYGYDTVLPPGTSKNVLTVGAVQDVYRLVGGVVQMGYATNASIVLAAFSGCGPTDDGRIKPEVVADGQANPNLRNYGIYTPADTGSGGSFDFAAYGTSYAAPAVTGGLGLVMQRRSQLFTNLDENLDAWRGSTWRALAIHTADDVGALGPDYLSGYGLFNAAKAVAQVERDQQDGRGTHIKEFQLDVGQTNSWEVDAGSTPFKVTVTWSDPAGPAANAIIVDPSTPMLVNNIDIRVERVGATNVYRPWILNPDLTNKTEAARSAAATSGVDSRNNVEQVYLANPTPGRYRIVVAHAGGLPGGPSPSSQWVTATTSGDTPLPALFTSIAPNPTATQFLLTFTADPGAYFQLLSSTNLTSWLTDGAVKAEGMTNSVLVTNTNTSPQKFWRLRRQQ